MNIVACVYWKGKFRGRERLYTVEWVRKLKNMVERNLSLDHKFVCFTNVPEEIDFCETIPLIHNLPGYWSKIEMFRPNVFENDDRILYLDLDMMIVDKLDVFFQFRAPFISRGPARSPKIYTKEGKKIIIRYSSTVLFWVPPNAEKIYTKFKPEVMSEYWGDQDWMTHNYPVMETFPIHWILKMKDLPNKKPKIGQKIMLCMGGIDYKRKNLDVFDKHEWAKKIWK